VDSDTRTFRSPEDKHILFDVTPEEICQYEKMQNSLYNLQNIGIQFLRVPDKMKQIISTFFKKNPEDLKKYAIARMINDELHLTSWYLTESFINAQQGQAKMELEGIGDPTNGHGGYSYIKKPQKERMDKDEQMVEKKPEKKVSGTGADLRKLKTLAVTEMLLETGIKYEEIQHMKRWARVDLLKRFGTGKYLRQ
jgi:transcription initiation factor TFIID subunit 1